MQFRQIYKKFRVLLELLKCKRCDCKTFDRLYVSADWSLWVLLKILFQMGMTLTTCFYVHVIRHNINIHNYEYNINLATPRRMALSRPLCAQSADLLKPVDHIFSTSSLTLQSPYSTTIRLFAPAPTDWRPAYRTGSDSCSKSIQFIKIYFFPEAIQIDTI